MPEQEQAILRQLKDYTLPELTLRNFPYGIYPFADGVRRYQVHWLRKQQIDTTFDNEKAFQRFVSYKVEDLSLMTHRNGNLTRVRWNANLYAVCTVADDKVDGTVEEGYPAEISIPFFVEFHLILLWAIPKQAPPPLQKTLDKMDNPAQRKSTEKLFKNVLAEAEIQPGTDYPGQLRPLGAGFRELWDQLAKQEGTVPSNDEVQDFLLGVLDEAKNRCRKTMPTVQEYIKMRRRTEALNLLVMRCTPDWSN